MLNKKTNLFLHPPLFLRRFFDLQFRTIEMNLKNTISKDKVESVLDFGSGQCSYKHLFNSDTQYKTLDPYQIADYNSLEQINEKFEIILALEVLEHIKNPTETILSLHDYLTPSGKLLISTPFSARIHRVPKDYFRFSIDYFQELKEIEEVKEIKIYRRGNNIDSLYSKVLYIVLRSLDQKRPYLIVIALFFLPLLSILFILSRVIESSAVKIIDDDPLGFFIEISFWQRQNGSQQEKE